MRVPSERTGTCYSTNYLTLQVLPGFAWNPAWESIGSTERRPNCPLQSNLNLDCRIGFNVFLIADPIIRAGSGDKIDIEFNNTRPPTRH